MQKDGSSNLEWMYGPHGTTQADGRPYPGGNFFGEGAILAARRARASDPAVPLRGASIIAKGAQTRCLIVTREAFLLVTDVDAIAAVNAPA